MFIIDSRPALAFALDRLSDPTLKALLTLRRDQLAEYDDDLINFVVVQPGDRIADVEAHLGFALFEKVGDDPESYDHFFEWIGDHGAWIEAPIIFDDSGAGVIMIVQNHDDVDADLLVPLRLMRRPAKTSARWRPDGATPGQN